MSALVDRVCGCCRTSMSPPDKIGLNIEQVFLVELRQYKFNPTALFQKKKINDAFQKFLRKLHCHDDYQFLEFYESIVNANPTVETMRPKLFLFFSNNSGHQINIAGSDKTLIYKYAFENDVRQLMSVLERIYKDIKVDMCSVKLQLFLVDERSAAVLIRYKDDPEVFVRRDANSPSSEEPTSSRSTEGLL